VSRTPGADRARVGTDETSEVEVDEQAVVAARKTLHAVAELVLAGPQYREHAEIRLKVTPGGFGQFVGPLRVEGVELVRGDLRVPLKGTPADLAAALGVEVGAPADLYAEHAELGPGDELVANPAAVALLLDWFGRGDRALRQLAPTEAPILWPEHFDLGIAVDEVNYGVSPGDRGHPLSYAYVGPWTPREGAFWNAPFGAVRDAVALPDVDAVADFFAEGRAAAAAP
jgi:hypothetical protein